MSSKKLRKDLKIAISGKSGCGNTTVSSLLARRLGLNLVNYTFRSVAKEDGISFEEVCKRAELSDDDDRRVDETQVRLARQGGTVLGSRLAIWMLEEADLKVYLTASPEKRASLIFSREGGSLDHQMAITAARDKRDHDRYLKLYEIDNDDASSADLVININRLSAEQVAQTIAATAETLVDSEMMS